MARCLQLQRKPKAQTFSPFGKLPLELREAIWFHALPEQGRIIELFLERKPPPDRIPQAFLNGLEPFELYPETCSIVVTSPTKPPHIFSACPEAEAETRRHYKTLDLGPGFYFPNEILVNYKVDTVYLSTVGNKDQEPMTGVSHLRGREYPILPSIDISQSLSLQHLQHLAIDASVWPHLHLKFLRTHPNISSLRVTFHKTVLQDIKPASESETLTFMPDTLYFSDKNWLTQGLFFADPKLRIKALENFGLSIFMIMKCFRSEGNDDTNLIGRYIGDRMVKEPWGEFCDMEDTKYYDVEIDGRIVGVRTDVALYPREKQYETLKSKSMFRDFRPKEVLDDGSFFWRGL